MEALPNLDTMTIAQLKEYGKERGFNECWLEGKRKSNYVDWIISQHDIEIDEKKADVAFDNILKNVQNYSNQKDDLKKKLEDYIFKKDELRAKINEELLIPGEKTTLQYQQLIKMYEMLVELTDVIGVLNNNPIFYEVE